MRKSMVFLSCLAIAALATAEEIAYTGQQKIGAIEVSGGKSMIVAVSFKELGAAPGPISVANIIATKNLMSGDKVYVYRGGNYSEWVLSSEKTWTPVQNVTKDANGDDSVTPGDAASDVKPAIGEGFWLIRQDATKPFYIFGEYVMPQQTTATAGVKTLMGNPTMKEQTISTKGSVPGDTISLIAGDGLLPVTYTYGTDYQGKTGWTCLDVVGGKLKTVVTQVPLPSGKGFWYNSVGPEDVTLSWVQ